MKKIISIALLVFLMSVPFVKASAHELRVNNGISVFLHIPPEDNPQAKASTKLEIEFSNETGNFLLNDYTVVAKADIGGKELASAPVKPAFYGSASQAVAYITFPKIDTYTLIVSGQANSHNVPNFEVRYPVTVATALNNQSSSKNRNIFIMLIVSTVIVVIGMGLIVRARSRRKAAN